MKKCLNIIKHICIDIRIALLYIFEFYEIFIIIR